MTKKNFKKIRKVKRNFSKQHHFDLSIIAKHSKFKAKKPQKVLEIENLASSS